MTLDYLPSDCEIYDRASGSIQCARSLHEEECLLLDSYLAKHPQANLRVFKKIGSSWDFDLSFLSYLPSLRHLDVDANAGDLNDLSPLEFITNKLSSLSLDTVGAFSDKKLDKAKINTHVLGRFEQLGILQICGHITNLDFIPKNNRIHTLSLWRTKLKSLDGIETATNLSTLAIHWAGSLSLEPIGQLRQLKALEAWDSRNVFNIEHVGKSPSLQRAWFVSCGRDFRIFDPTLLLHLRVAVIHSSTGPKNIETLSKAPDLRCLIISNSPEKLNYSDFRPLFGHSSLREIRVDNVERGVLEALSNDHGWTVSSHPNFPADEHLS